MPNRLLAIVPVLLLILLLILPDGFEIARDFWHFFIVGLVGAVVANSTGAGGGIIFVPFFSSVGITPIETLATSILIQCFGMTAGSLGWFRSIRKGEHFSSHHLELQLRILAVSVPAVMLGVACAQLEMIRQPLHMLGIFRIFSVMFGAGLLYLTLRKQHHLHSRSHLTSSDQAMLALTAFSGGLVTAWISIGVGEIVAIYLIIRKFPIMIAVSTGVCLSAASVLTAAPMHIVAGNPVWEIVLFAAPAAIIGGTLARYLSFRLGPTRLKVFFATWVLVTGLVM